ncbi:M14 family zinc carboxypeptidase [Halobacteriovorax sp. HLS]|uniref:M14 family zinc carboxypeptidase n=1 Tax=Halobacteriovorax sp. HLS TaxID=2234000 RepID=UPI0013E2D866|nr:M14 family zinc carboxypeptidase [Halobacteriovorax sp. HLS]
MSSKLTFTFLILALLSSCARPSFLKDSSEEKQANELKSVKVPVVEVAPKPVVKEKKVLPKLELWPKIAQNNKVAKYCKKVDKKFHHWGWGKSRCQNIEWLNVRTSHLGDPLIWAVYGDESKLKEGSVDMTLILCGVHGDEITPIKFCFDIIHHLERVTKNHLPGHEDLKDKLVVVAPIVNPDSFFKRRPTRTNARGVDVNRNFPTKDWSKDARRLWISRYKRDKRRNPGRSALSEQETVFQVNLIKRYSPAKIISVHAPLTIIDYDGPEFAEHSHEAGQFVVPNAKQLLVQMSQKANDYKIKNYPFFPGSLGNYAGNERKIPTYTIELPTSDNRRHKDYWNTFKDAIHSAITHDMNKDVEVATAPDEDKAATTN